jgi:hypothetical protein
MLLSQIKAVESSIESLEARLLPLDTQLDQVYSRFQALRQDIEATSKALKGNANRTKADTLGRVLKTIVVHSGPNTRPDPRKRGRKFNTVPTQVVFHPIQGEPWEINLVEEEP